MRTGPDGRVWFCTAPYVHACNLEAIRAAVEQAFNTPAPGLYGAVPIAFEPGGRVWFRCGDGLHILGYNGTGWLEHALTVTPRDKSCESAREVNGLCCAGMLFLQTHDAVEVFDGSDWQRFADSLFAATRKIRLRQGGGSVWITAEKSPQLLQWRDRDWVVAPGIAEYADIHALGSDGSIWLSSRDGLRRLAGASPSNPMAVNLVRQLIGAASTEAKVAIVHQLERIAPDDPALLDTALASTLDPEILDSLVQLARRWQQVVPTGFSFGEWSVTTPSGCAADAAGNLFFYGGNLVTRKAPRGAGTLMVRTDGRAVPIWTGTGSLAVHADWSTAAVSPDGTELWVSGNSESDPACCFDLVRGSLRYRLDQPCLHAIGAVLSDGRVVAGARGFWTLASPAEQGEKAQCLATSDLIPLREHSDSAWYAVDGSGTLWLKPRLRPLFQFTSAGWTQTSLLYDYEWIDCLRLGQGGDMLLAVENEGPEPGPVTSGWRPYFVYIHAGQADRDADLFRLMERRRDAMVQGFVQSPMPRFSEACVGVVADRNGCLWGSDHQDVRVLVGDDWVDFADRQYHAGSGITVLPFGQGTRVLMCGYPCFMIAALVHGKIEFEHLLDRRVAQMGVFDRIVQEENGAIWYPYDRSGRCPGHECTPSEAVRISEPATIEVLPDSLLPVHGDVEGNVWFVSPARRGMVYVRSPEGSMFQTIVDGAGNNHTHVATPRAGCAYIATPLGLFQLERVPGAPLNAYTIQRRCALDDLRGPIDDLRSLQTGHLLVKTPGAIAAQQFHLLRIDHAGN